MPILGITIELLVSRLLFVTIPIIISFREFTCLLSFLHLQNASLFEVVHIVIHTKKWVDRAHGHVLMADCMKTVIFFVHFAIVSKCVAH